MALTYSRYRLLENRKESLNCAFFYSSIYLRGRRICRSKGCASSSRPSSTREQKVGPGFAVMALDCIPLHFHTPNLARAF